MEVFVASLTWLIACWQPKAQQTYRASVFLGITSKPAGRMSAWVSCQSPRSCCPLSAQADIGIAPIRQPRGAERLLGVGGTLFRFHQPLFILGGELGPVDRQRQFVESVQKDRDGAR